MKAGSVGVAVATGPTKTDDRSLHSVALPAFIANPFTITDAHLPRQFL